MLELTHIPGRHCSNPASKAPYLAGWIMDETNRASDQQCARAGMLPTANVVLPLSGRGIKRVVRACFMLRITVTRRFCEAKFRSSKIE
jgi:hypothetical protein